MLEIRFGSPLQLGKINKLTRWFPRLWWGQNTSDDYEVKIDVPEEYIVATSGIYDKTRNHYSAKGVREFGIVMMRDLEILKASSVETEIYCYYEKAAGKCAELIHQTAIEAIEFYQDWLGFYPHKVLHIVPGGLSHPAGGYPVATAIVGIHGQKRMNEKPKSHWQFITAHEIGHQYWMEHVLEASDTFWLMIGLGVYADRAFMLAKGYGDRHERDMIQRYIDGARDMLDTRMNRLVEEGRKVDFDYNNIVNHGKGFGVISALACMMGQNRFESAYRRCLKEFKGRPLGVADFQRVCEEESGEKLDWFFDQWVRTSRFLSYEIVSHETSSKNGEYVTTAKVRRLGTLSMPVPVTAFFQDDSRQCLYTDRFLDECSLAFKSEVPLKEIKLDAKDELPLIVPPPDSETAQLKKDIRSLEWTGAGGKALQIYTKNRDINLEDAGLLFKLGMCLYDGEHYEESLQIFRKCAVLSRDIKSNSLYYHLTWQGHVLDLLNRREEALLCYEEALRHCGSRSVRHDQYRMVTDRSWIEKRIKSPFQRPDPKIINMIEQINALELIGDGCKALQLFNVAKNAKFDDYSIPWFKLAFCLYDGQYYEEALQAFRNNFESSPKTTRSHLFASLVWQGHILDLMNRRDEALLFYRKALQSFDKYHPRNDWIKHSQYGMTIDRDWIEQRLKTPFQRD